MEEKKVISYSPAGNNWGQLRSSPENLKVTSFLTQQFFAVVLGFDPRVICNYAQKLSVPKHTFVIAKFGTKQAVK